VHGIGRTRKLQEELPRGTRIYRIVFRYSDGMTLTFIPEAGREYFSADDVHELVKVLERASSTAEWSEVDSSISSAGG
jgi:hypothetical protein